MISPVVFRRLARVAVRRLFYFGIGAAAGSTRKMRRPSNETRRILVIRLDLLGDVLFSLQAVEGLRRAYPRAHIAMMTLPYTAPLARLSPSVDEVIEVDSNRVRKLSGLIDPRTWRAYWDSYRQVRNGKYDLAISLSGRTASLCALLSGAPRIIGYSAEAYPFVLTDAVPGGRYKERIPEAEYVRRLARLAGARDFPERVDIPIPEDARRRAARLLAGHGIGENDRLVLVHAGAVNGAAKRWPPSSWAGFIAEVGDRVQARVVLIGAASDRPIARQVLAEAPRETISLVGETSVEELLAVIARADLLASGDSGPLHLAVALGRPVTAVYGPTDTRIHGPYHAGAPALLHRYDLPCSPCYSMAAMAECPLGDPICMRLVPVHSMVKSAVQLLDTGAG